MRAVGESRTTPIRIALGDGRPLGHRTVSPVRTTSRALLPPGFCLAMRAGAWLVVPAMIKPALAHHVAAFTASLPDSLVFTSPTGALLRDGNFRRRVWYRALAKAALPAIHFHDPRQTDNTLTAPTGASLRELMDRMGYSSPCAALIYLHGSDARQRAIADGLNRLVEGELRVGTQGTPKQARRRHRARGGHARGGEHRDSAS
jgi:hypothetical protein